MIIDEKLQIHEAYLEELVQEIDEAIRDGAWHKQEKISCAGLFALVHEIFRLRQELEQRCVELRLTQVQLKCYAQEQLLAAELNALRTFRPVGNVSSIYLWQSVRKCFAPNDSLTEEQLDELRELYAEAGGWWYIIPTAPTSNQFISTEEMEAKFGHMTLA